MSEEKRSLEEIRKDIDGLDDQLVQLLFRRAELAQEVGRTKSDSDQPYFTPEREREIYSKLREQIGGPLTPAQLQAIFREVISAARAAERPLSVAFWGPIGTHSHAAALQAFGASTEFLPQESISDLFRAVEHRKADYGVVPVENSVAGVVPETLDMFPQTNVKICSELFIPIAHHLVGLSQQLGSIEKVFAGPQPLAQCRKWLKANIPSAEILEVMPTAKAIQLALETPNSAAIAGSLGASLYDAEVLQEHIEDNPQNRTRFWIIGYNEPRQTGSDKTSLMFNLRNRPGELYRALGAFVAQQVNLLMIESRPAQRATFEYIFFVDCEGHRHDESVKRALESLRSHALETTVLGSYPSA